MQVAKKAKLVKNSHQPAAAIAKDHSSRAIVQCCELALVQHQADTKNFAAQRRQHPGAEKTTSKLRTQARKRTPEEGTPCVDGREVSASYRAEAEAGSPFAQSYCEVKALTNDVGAVAPQALSKHQRKIRFPKYLARAGHTQPTHTDGPGREGGVRRTRRVNPQAT